MSAINQPENPKAVNFQSEFELPDAVVAMMPGKKGAREFRTQISYIGMENE